MFTCDYLEVARVHLTAAQGALRAELAANYDTYLLTDALNLTSDALTQLEGEIEHRAEQPPVRTPYLGGASA